MCADTIRTTRFWILERLDFVLRTTRFHILLTRLMNFASIFSPIFEPEKTEGVAHSTHLTWYLSIFGYVLIKLQQ